MTDQDGNEPPRTADMHALFTAIINDDPLPGENDQNAQSRARRQGRAPAPTHARASPPAPSSDPNTVQVADDLATGRHRAGVQRDRQDRSGHDRRHPAEAPRLQGR